MSPELRARRHRAVVMLLENNGYPRDVRVRREAEALTAAGYAVTVIAPREAGESPRGRVGGVTVRRFWLPPALPGPAGFFVEYAVATVQLVLHGIWQLMRGADIVHLHNPPDTLFPTAWIARVFGRRVVFDLHDLAPELFVEKYGHGPLERVLQFLEKRSVTAADQVLTVNQSLGELASARDGVAEDRITVVRNVPPVAMIRSAQPPRDGVLDDPRLVFVGTMELQDGVDSLPPLLELLDERYDLGKATLTVVGDGSRRAALEHEFEATGSGHRVTFTGFVPHEQITGFLADADICIEPAPRGPLNDRCSMVKVAEYMAAGRPVVCFPLPEVQRMAGAAALYADSGTLDELAAHVATLAQSPSRRRELASVGQARARELTWEHSVAALIGAYDKLPESSRARR